MRNFTQILLFAICPLINSCLPDGYLYDITGNQPSVKPEVVPEPEPEPEPFVVPVIKIDIEGGGEIVSKEEYVSVSVTITEGEEVTLFATGRAKGRGNATWDFYPKKPFKIKFDEKQSLLGFPENKDWVLLAEYCDKSIMRTAYMCELADFVGLPYPIRYRHVQLYLNGEYNGMYVLTDQVEKKKGRVNIEDDGFLFENDNYFWAEPLFFLTDKKQYWYTFKYPDPEDGEIVYGDESFNFITGFMNDFEQALYGENFTDPEIGYRKYIDPEVFAKWCLVQELTANLEPNMYYVLPSRDSKLQIAPVWDAEWSMGLAYREEEYSSWGELPTQPDPNQKIWSQWKYFGRLFEDPYFVDVVRKEWEKLYPRIPDFQKKMDFTAECIKEDQILNFEKWQTLGWHVSVGLVCFDTWEEEVAYVKDFFAKRVAMVETFLAEN